VAFPLAIGKEEKKNDESVNPITQEKKAGLAQRNNPRSCAERRERDRSFCERKKERPSSEGACFRPIPSIRQGKGEGKSELLAISAK